MKNKNWIEFVFSIFVLSPLYYQGLGIILINFVGYTLPLTGAIPTLITCLYSLVATYVIAMLV